MEPLRGSTSPAQPSTMPKLPTVHRKGGNSSSIWLVCGLLVLAVAVPARHLAAEGPVTAVAKSGELIGFLMATTGAALRYSKPRHQFQLFAILFTHLWFLLSKDDDQ